MLVASIRCEHTEIYLLVQITDFNFIAFSEKAPTFLEIMFVLV